MRGVKACMFPFGEETLGFREPTRFSLEYHCSPKGWEMSIQAITRQERAVFDILAPMKTMHVGSCCVFHCRPYQMHAAFDGFWMLLGWTICFKHPSGPVYWWIGMLTPEWLAQLRAQPSSWVLPHLPNMGWSRRCSNLQLLHLGFAGFQQIYDRLTCSSFKV